MTQFHRDRRPVLTVQVTDHGDERWLIAIGAIAATPVAGVLRKQGVAEADVDKVWEAIALHACIGIADRRGLLTYLTHRGVFMDIGRTEDPVASQLRQEVFTAYPRPAGDRSIADAIVKHAARSEAAAPRGSLAAELLREHREAGGAV